MRITVLGCGGSGGVPLINGNWGSCNPANPKNMRRRVSVLVQEQGVNILIDTSPDLRLQLLDNNVRKIDAVLYTHDHADHCHGIDELRAMSYDKNSQPIDAFGTPVTMAALRQRFGYIFDQAEGGPSGLYRPVLRARDIDGPFETKGVSVLPFEQDHGFGSVTTGYRIGGFAYSTDVVDLPAAAKAVLTGLDLWIVDCLRFEPHPTHAHFDRTIGWISELKPKRTILTHLNHMMDYEEVARRCPPGVEPGYDRLTVDLE
jgi:phosphoribosyl 1,2-cyclic phosphate phosphodiesterase